MELDKNTLKLALKWKNFKGLPFMCLWVPFMCLWVGLAVLHPRWWTALLLGGVVFINWFVLAVMSGLIVELKKAGKI